MKLGFFKLDILKISSTLLIFLASGFLWTSFCSRRSCRITEIGGHCTIPSYCQETSGLLIGVGVTLLFYLIYSLAQSKRRI